MPVRFLDHTGDVGFELSAASLPELFAEAQRAFTTTLIPLAQVREREHRRVELSAPDLEQLLVGWLEELHYDMEVGGRLVRRAEVEVTREGEAWSLRATLHGEPRDPEAHHLNLLIKGVTYHQLEVRPEERGGWFARVVLDI